MHSFQIGDLVRCQPDHPDQRIHEIVSITDHPARPAMPEAFGYVADKGCDAYTTICAVPITAYPEHGKSMSPEGFIPVEKLSDGAMSWLGAKLAVRASAHTR